MPACIGNGPCPHDHPEQPREVVILTTWVQRTVITDPGRFAETGDLDDLPDAELERVETPDPESMDLIDWYDETEETS